MRKNRSAYILLFAGIFSLCIFSFLFYKRIELLVRSYEMINRTTQASLEVDKLFLSLRDATVNFRNYTSTRDKNLLGAFNAEIKQYPQIIIQLNKLEAGNAEQQKNVEHLNHLAGEYVKYIESLITDPAHPPTEKESEQVRNMLNNIRAQVNVITSAESKITVHMDTELSKHIYTTPLFLLIFSLTSLAIILYAFFSILRQVKKTQMVKLSETRFKNLIKQAPLPITIYKGADSIIEIINDKALDIVGKSASEIIGKPAFNLLPESKYLKDVHQKVLKEGKSVILSEFKLKLLKNDNYSDYYFDLVYEPLFDEDGEIMGIMGIGTEVTDQVLARRKAEESEKRFRALIENSIDVIALANAQGIFKYVSTSVKNILGYDESDLYGRQALEFINPDDIPALIENSKPMVEHKSVVKNTVRFLHKNGNWRWVESTVSNLLHIPYINAYVCNIHDITEQKETQDTLKQSEHRFRILAESLPQLVWMTDEKGNYDYASSRWPEYTGINTFSYDIWQTIVHPEDLKELGETWATCLQTGETYEAEVRLKNKNGSYRWHFVRGVSVRNDAGEIIKWIGAFTDVHEQKTIHELIKRSEENFRQLADLIPQIIWTADTTGYIDYYNKRWYDYTGFEEDYGDRSWIPIMHPDDVKLCIDSWYKSVKTGKPFQAEYRFKDRQNPGSYRWFLGKALPIKNTQEVIVKWFGTFTDIHDQKTITEKLEQLVKERAAELTAKNKDLNEAQSLAHIGSWEWDIKNDKLFWTDELYRIYGVIPETFETKYENYTALIHPDDREYAKHVIQNAFDNRSSFDFYHRILRPDGTIRTIHGRGKVYTNEHNEPVRMAGTGQDITETVEIQNQINELNHTFNFAEQTSLTGSFRYNFSTKTFTYSDNLYRLLGYEPGEFKPTPENFTRSVHPEDIENIIEQTHGFDQSHISSEYQFRILRKNGSVIYARNTGILIKEKRDRIYIGTIQDITAQRNKERQLLEQNTTLEEMNKELASFSYIASHDLQEPLRKIRMFTRRIAEKEITVLSDDAKEYFNRIENAATRMQQLIDDLLSYSRTNTMQAHFELTNLDKLLEDVSDSLKEKIAQTHTVIESSGLHSAKVIPFQFKQLLTNLFTNSMKFTRPNITPHIHISHKILNTDKNKTGTLLQKINYHHFTIKDNGIGFEPQYNEQIFGLFQRLHGRNEFEGTGIGLAICKKIMENHNGVITAIGEVDKGATFNIYIPVEQNTGPG